MQYIIFKIMLKQYSTINQYVSWPAVVEDDSKAPFFQ